MDTNHIPKLLDGHIALQRKLFSSQHQEDEIGISTTVLGELYFAAYASERKEQNL